MKSFFQKHVYAPSAYYDPHAERRKRDFLTMFGHEAKLLDVGSGSQKLDPRVLCINIEPFKNVDVVGDAHFLPFKDNSHKIPSSVYFIGRK